MASSEYVPGQFAHDTSDVKPKQVDLQIPSNKRIDFNASPDNTLCIDRKPRYSWMSIPPERKRSQRYPFEACLSLGGLQASGNIPIFDSLFHDLQSFVAHPQRALHIFPAMANSRCRINRRDRCCSSAIPAARVSRCASRIPDHRCRTVKRFTGEETRQ